MNYLRVLIVIGIAIFWAGCVPPTPPPSPTPWPTATPAATDTVTPAAGVGATAATRTPTSTPTKMPTPSVTEISVWHSLPEAQATRLREDVEAFQEKFPKYRIVLQHYDRSEEFLVSVLTDEVAFDVVLASSPLLGNLWAARQITPVNEFFSPDFLNGFAAVTLTGAQQDGQLWGLPDTAGFHLLLFYNRDMVDVPPVTMKDFSDIAETLSTTSQRSLGVNSYDPLWLIPWLTAYGGWLMDDSGEPKLNTEAMISAISLHLDWYDSKSGIASPQIYEEMRNEFLSGNLATMIDGEWAIRELANTDQINWGVAALPHLAQKNELDQQPAPLILGRYWAISSTAAEGNRAAGITTFLEYITQPERQLELFADFGLLPTQRQALSDPLVVNDPVLRASAAQLQAGRSLPLKVNPNTLLDAMRGPLREAVDGNISPEEAAEAMQNNLVP